MLTRIEIDGFKTFDGFSLDLSPFLVIVGPTAVGTSNLFDAIQLLSRLAGRDLRKAVGGVRGGPEELFRVSADEEPARRMALAAEVLLDPTVRDPWGSRVDLTHTRIRYEVILERRRDVQGRERLFVAHEQALPILHRDDRWRPYGRAPADAFQRAVMRYRRRPPFLETVVEGGTPGFAIHHDGQAGRTRAAQAIEATVLSSITSAEFPHLYALRREMRSWRLLKLDAERLRGPSPVSAAEGLDPSGANLGTVLARIRAETADESRPDGALDALARDVSAVVPGVVGVHVDEDRRRREFRVSFTARDGAPVSSSVASDGALRVLATLAAIHDPRHGRVLCVEEPENGLHPAWLRRLLARVRSRVTDPSVAPPEEGVRLCQVVANSHSLMAIVDLGDGEMVYADLEPAGDDGGPSARRTVMRPIAPRDQGVLSLTDARRRMSRFDVERRLTEPRDVD